MSFLKPCLLFGVLCHLLCWRHGERWDCHDADTRNTLQYPTWDRMALLESKKASDPPCAPYVCVSRHLPRSSATSRVYREVQAKRKTSGLVSGGENISPLRRMPPHGRLLCPKLSPMRSAYDENVIQAVLGNLFGDVPQVLAYFGNVERTCLMKTIRTLMNTIRNWVETVPNALDTVFVEHQGRGCLRHEYDPKSCSNLKSPYLTHPR